MRILIFAILAAAVGYSAFWYFGVTKEEQAIAGWLGSRGEEGWIAEYNQLETKGFPNRFDTTITELQVVDPQTGIAWTAPIFQLLRLSYEPKHYIAVWPSTQVFATPHQTISIESENAKASVVFSETSSYRLNRANFAADLWTMSSNSGWAAELTAPKIAVRENPNNAELTDVSIDVAKFIPSGTGMSQISDLGLVSEALDVFKLSATFDFDAPLDRKVIEIERPNIAQLDLHLAQAKWGELEIWAAGKLDVDRVGNLSGSLTIKAKNWPELLAIAESTGRISKTVISALETGLGVLSQLSGPNETLDAPLRFENGKVFLGPIPLGSAPKLVIR